jgi:hypothetical protein
VKGIPITTLQSATKTEITSKYDVDEILDSLAYYQLKPFTNNTAFGYLSLFSNTEGQNNTALGHLSLKNNFSGHNNTASGFEALYSNTTGSENTAYGIKSLYNNISGSENIAIGENSLYNNISGIYNISIGSSSLVYNTTGNYNTSIGGLFNNISGVYNTAIGSSSLGENTTGNYNVALGDYAGNTLVGNGNQFSNYSTFIGSNAKPQNNNDTMTTVIGANSVGHGHKTVTIGNQSITDSTFLYGILKINGSQIATSNLADNSHILKTSTVQTIISPKTFQESSVDSLVTFERNGQTTNNIFMAQKLLSTKTTDMGDEFGTGLLFNIRDDANVVNPIGSIGAVRSGADNTGALIFKNTTTGNETEAMRIIGGKVGVGTTVPDKQVEINSADGTNLRLTYNDNNGSATNYTDFAVSSSGDLTVTPSGGDVTVGGLLTVNTGIIADADDGAYIGDATHQFSDLFLAEGGVVNWDNGDVTLTQTGNNATVAGGDFQVNSGVYSLKLGANTDGYTVSNNAAKMVRVGGLHYTSDTEEPIHLIMGNSTATENLLKLGGGTAYMNACTSVSIFTAANNTTVTGAERFRLISTGFLGLNTTAPDKQVEINSDDGNNLRLTYNDANGSAANYADFTVTSGGNLGITPSGGTASVTGILTVSSSVKVGTDATSATAANIGAIRYRADASNSWMEMVMQTGASTYAWVVIKTNTW